MKEASQNIITAKSFIVKRSELENKLEASFYNPKIRIIEQTIKAKSSKTLKDFIIRISSGSTPPVNDPEKYYSDKQNGVPFLRVQNLKSNGQLNLKDVKYINTETHNKYLKRSQVLEGDLLVKITGVGRMAIASVAPEGFEGNTNQHMAVIKTNGRLTSEYLANYLNLDVIEKLASLRATGGTRPALDYTALKSIPIIEDIDFTLLQNAESFKQQKQAEAKKLLQSIDSYLLTELGLDLPIKDNNIDNRIFTINFNEISNRRLDPDYNSKYEFIVNQKANFNFVNLGSLTVKSPQYGANEEAANPTSENNVRYLRITDINEYGILKMNKWKTANTINEIYKLNYNDVLFARSGSVGRCYIHKQTKQKTIFAGYLIRFVFDETKVLPDFIFNFCNSSIYKFWVSAIERPAVQSNINSEEFKSLPIPLPDIAKQKEIVDYINIIREKIATLESEAKQILKDAKQEIEKLIIG